MTEPARTHRQGAIEVETRTVVGGEEEGPIACGGDLDRALEAKGEHLGRVLFREFRPRRDELAIDEAFEPGARWGHGPFDELREQGVELGLAAL